MKLTKIFDILFVIGACTWLLFAWILPALFNADSDVTLWMVYLTIFLVIYGVGRSIIKLVSKLIAD